MIAIPPVLAVSYLSTHLITGDVLSLLFPPSPPVIGDVTSEPKGPKENLYFVNTVHKPDDIYLVVKANEPPSTKPSSNLTDKTSNNYTCKDLTSQDNPLEDVHCQLYQLNKESPTSTSINTALLNNQLIPLIDKAHLVADSYHILKTTKTFYESFKEKTDSSISVLDPSLDDSSPNTFITLKPEFILNKKHQSPIKSNLHYGQSFDLTDEDIKNKVDVHTDYTCKLKNTTSTFNCSLYTKDTPFASNNLETSTLTGLKNPSASTDIKNHTYYILDTKDTFFSKEELMNKTIEVFAKESTKPPLQTNLNTATHKLFSFIYDQSLFSKPLNSNSTNTIFTTQKIKKTFLIKKNQPLNSTFTLSSDSLCNHIKQPTTSTFAITYDYGCALYDIPYKSDSIPSLEEIKSSKTKTTDTSLKANEYFKLELDNNVLYNLEQLKDTSSQPLTINIQNKEYNTKPPAVNSHSFTITQDITDKLSIGSAQLVLLSAIGNEGLAKYKEDIIDCLFSNEDKNYPCELRKAPTQWSSAAVLEPIYKPDSELGENPYQLHNFKKDDKYILQFLEPVPLSHLRKQKYIFFKKRKQHDANDRFFVAFPIQKILEGNPSSPNTYLSVT